MKKGDLVRFINQNHYLYREFCTTTGIVTEINHEFCNSSPFKKRHFGAKVLVVFDGKLITCPLYSLEVINGNK